MMLGNFVKLSISGTCGKFHIIKCGVSSNSVGKPMCLQFQQYLIHCYWLLLREDTVL